MTTTPVPPDLEAARALRKRLVPVIFEVTVYPADQKELRGAFPLGLIKLPPWLRDGLETPEDINNPQCPAAAFAFHRMGLGISLADDYNISHNSRHQGSSPQKVKRSALYEDYRARLQDAALWDDRMASRRDALLEVVNGIKASQFREFCEMTDILLRAAAYEDGRRRLTSGRNWMEVTDGEREEIVSDVLTRLYKDTCRTFWGTPADDPEHPVPLRDDLSEETVRALLRAEVGCIAFEGTGCHLPRNWWVVKVKRTAHQLIHHSGHDGTHRLQPARPYTSKIPHNTIPRVTKGSITNLEMLMENVFTIGSRRRVMDRVRAHSKKSGRSGAEGLPSKEWRLVNTTSRAKLTDFGRALSPMLPGPVPLWNGEKSQTLEAAWQFSKVYGERTVRFCVYHRALAGPDCTARGCERFTKVMEPVDHIGADGMPNDNWWDWARGGWGYAVDESDPHSREYLRRPMGGARAVYTFWGGQRLSYIEARKEVYIPLYVEAVTQTAAWRDLKALYDEGECIRLYDVDGRNLYNLDMTYEQALNDPAHPFGHSLVLCALLEGVDLSALQVWDCNRLNEAELARASFPNLG